MKAIGNVPSHMKEGLSLEIDMIYEQLSGKNDVPNVTVCSNRTTFQNYVVSELKKRTDFERPELFASSLPTILFIPYPPPEICIDMKDLSIRSETEKRLALAHEIAHYVLKEYPSHGTPEFMNSWKKILALTRNEAISGECFSALANLIGDKKAYELMFRGDISYQQLALEALLEEKKRLNAKELGDSIRLEDLTFSYLILLTARNAGRISVILALQKFNGKLAEEYQAHWFEVIDQVMANAPLVSLAIRRMTKRYSEFELNLDSVVQEFIEICTECFQDFK